VLQQKGPADLAVADQARIGRLAARIPIQKVLHNGLVKDILGVDHIKRDIKFRRDPSSLCHRVRAAAAVGLLLARFTPQAQHHAHDLIALLFEQGCGNRGVDSSRHGDDNSSHSQKSKR
jgi:hypothetical protein